jgi:hypothetical protein
MFVSTIEISAAVARCSDERRDTALRCQQNVNR